MNDIIHILINILKDEAWRCCIFATFFLALSLGFFIAKIARRKGSVFDLFSFGIFLGIFLSGFFVLQYSIAFIENKSVFGIVERLYSSLKFFYADGTAKFNIADPALNKVCHILYYIIAFSAPLTLIYTVLAYFSNIFKLVHIRFSALFNNLIIFSELNQKNLAIAENFKQSKINNYEKSKMDVANAFFEPDKYFELEKKKKRIIFCDVYKENTEASAELIETANKMGCILLKDDIVAVHNHIHKLLRVNSKNKLTRYFISGSDENENVHQAIEISGKVEEEPINNLALFVFAEQDSNGHIIEALNTRVEFFVKRIKPSFMMAIDVLTAEDNRLTSYEKNSQEKDLKVLILGLGNYGLEIGKFLSWYYQRLKGNITIYFVDKNKNATSSLTGNYSDFFNYKPDLRNDRKELNACFECKIYEGYDVFSIEFTNLLKDVFYDNKSDSGLGLDAVFCVLGDDNQNIEAALHIRKLLDRINYNELEKINIGNLENYNDKFNEYIEDFKENNPGENLEEHIVELENKFEFSPEEKDFVCSKYDYISDNGKHTVKDNIKIFSVIHSDRVKKNIVDSQGFIKKCNINFVGEDSSVYGYGNVFDVEIERKAVDKNKRKNKNKNENDNLIDYNSTEYKRNSSLAEIFFEDYIETMYPVKRNGNGEIDTKYRDNRQKIGNKRWNAYMLANGYTHYAVSEEFTAARFDVKEHLTLPVASWERGKWHNSILSYDKLCRKEQENNYVDREDK